MMIRHIPFALAVILAVGDRAGFLDHQLRAGFTVCAQGNHDHKRIIVHQPFRFAAIFGIGNGKCV